MTIWTRIVVVFGYTLFWARRLHDPIRPNFGNVDDFFFGLHNTMMTSGGSVYMTDRLPSRADPALLITLCQILTDEGPSTTNSLQTRVDSGDRTLHETVEYGERLGFVSEREGELKLSIEIRIESSAEDSDWSVERAFRRGIVQYEPYRTVIETICTNEPLPEVLAKQSITKEFTQEALEDAIESTVTERAVLLLLKTLHHAGLGSFVHGRKGYPTRVEVTDDFDQYCRTVIAGRGQEDVQTARSGAFDSEVDSITISVEVDVSTKSPEEVAALVSRIQSVLRSQIQIAAYSR